MAYTSISKSFDQMSDGQSNGPTVGLMPQCPHMKKKVMRSIFFIFLRYLAQYLGSLAQGALSKENFFIAHSSPFLGYFFENVRFENPIIINGDNEINTKVTGSSRLPGNSYHALFRSVGLAVTRFV